MWLMQLCTYWTAELIDSPNCPDAEVVAYPWEVYLGELMTEVGVGTLISTSKYCYESTANQTYISYFTTQKPAAKPETLEHRQPSTHQRKKAE